MSELTNSFEGKSRPPTSDAGPGAPVAHETRHAARHRKSRSSPSIAKIREKLGDEI